MSDALLLFLALPQSYFATITLHFTGWYLSLIPASGAVSLLIGVALAIVRKENAAWWTLLPISLSQFLVVLAGLFRGQLTATEWGASSLCCASAWPVDFHRSLLPAIARRRDIPRVVQFQLRSQRRPYCRYGLR